MGFEKASAQAEGIETEIRNPLFEYVRYTEFKRLLGQITLKMDREGLCSLAVVSELPEEGRTFLVSALALGYTLLLDRRVLVVNTASQSQYRALLHQRVFELGREPGCASGVGGPPAPPDARGAESRGLLPKGIDLISPFDGGGGDLPISSDFQLGKYVESVKSGYDLILFDTCALSVSNKQNMDPVVISRQADTAILLTSWKSMSRETLAQARERVRQWNIRLMGTLFNAGVGTEGSRKGMKR